MTMFLKSIRKVLCNSSNIPNQIVDASKMLIEYHHHIEVLIGVDEASTMLTIKHCNLIEKLMLGSIYTKPVKGP